MEQAHTDAAQVTAADATSDTAERAVLSGILLAETVSTAVAELVEPQMFQTEAHQMLYAAMLACTARGAHVDPITLGAELNSKIERAGGMEYIAELIGEVPTAGHVADHAAIVRAEAMRRGVAEAARAVSRAAEDPAVSPAELALRAQGLLERVLNDSAAPLAFDPPVLAAFAAEAPPRPEWVLPGYAARGAVTVIGGHAKAGKTTFVAEGVGAVSAGALFLGEGTGGGAVLWIDLDQPKGLTAARLREHCLEAAPVYVQWGALPTFEAMRHFCKRAQVALVVIDSLVQVYELAGVEDENDAVQVGRALRPILDLARRANVAVVLIHHLRKSEGNEGLDLRGSGALAAAVDVVVSFRRYSPAAEDDDAQRVLQAYSRYEETPRKVVIERVDRRYRSCGTPGEVRRRAERDKVLTVLGPEPQTAEEVAAAADMAPSAARTVLKLLSTEPDGTRVVLRSGTGKKGSAYRYARAPFGGAA